MRKLNKKAQSSKENEPRRYPSYLHVEKIPTFLHIFWLI